MRRTIQIASRRRYDPTDHSVFPSSGRLMAHRMTGQRRQQARAAPPLCRAAVPSKNRRNGPAFRA